MKKILWLEGACGIAGDMTVAALLDLGADKRALDDALGSLGVGGFSYEILKDASHGIAGTRFNVHLHEHHEHHHHAHDEHGEHHHAPHRHLADIEEIIARGKMSDGARSLALKTFRTVADAEAKAHGVSVDAVHFHEIGAEDSIADIVGACVLFDNLGIGECVVDGLTEGSGTVVCAHGELPVPVPAVLNIAAANAIPLRKSNARGELVTPTGIALAATFRTRDTLPEKFRIAKTGIGLGSRDIGRPNILRAILLEENDACGNRDSVWQIEANIDDATGEMLGFAMEKIFEAGALDVCFAPCFMKKNRPAQIVKILADDASLAAVENALFKTTTTIGLRKWKVARVCMEREIITVSLPCGNVRVKLCRSGETVRLYPEFNDVRAIAEKTGRAISDIFSEAVHAANSR